MQLWDATRGHGQELGRIYHADQAKPRAVRVDHHYSYENLASQISQPVDMVDRLDTQYEKLHSQLEANVGNASAISIVSCMKSSLMLVPEPVIEPIVDYEEKMACLPKRCGVSFDPSLKLNSYIMFLLSLVG